MRIDARLEGTHIAGKLLQEHKYLLTDLDNLLRGAA